MLEPNSMESSLLLTLKGLGKERGVREERRPLDPMKRLQKTTYGAPFARSPDTRWTSAGSSWQTSQRRTTWEDSPKAMFLQPESYQSEEEKAFEQPNSMGLNQEDIEKLRNLLGFF